MKRWLVVALSAALLIFGGTTARADQDPRPHGGAGGGPLSPAEVAGAAAKDAAIKAMLAEMSVFPSVSSRPDASSQTLPPDCTDCAVARGSLYQEPSAINGVNYGVNWCGPGATSALASAWKYKNLGYDDIPSYSRSSNPDNTVYRTFFGSTAFMHHLAYDLDEMRYWTTGQPINEPSMDIAHEDTNESGLANTANVYAGYQFYHVNPNASLSTLKSYMRADIGVYEVPLAVIVQVCPIGLSCLQGWTGGGSDIMHWVTAGAYDMGTDLITYGDSAGPNQSYGQNPYGWHDRGITELYNTYMLGFGRAAVVF